jgi:hypothetical protein
MSTKPPLAPKRAPDGTMTYDIAAWPEAERRAATDRRMTRAEAEDVRRRYACLACRGRGCKLCKQAA